MKKILLVFLIPFYAAPLNAQDLIVRRDGSEEQVKVLEISETNVKYKKWSNLNGPTYNIAVSDLFIIKYQDGSKDVFKEKSVEKPNTQTVPSEVPSVPVIQKVEPKRRDTRWYISPFIQPQINVLTLDEEYDYSTNTKYKSTSGVRALASFGAELDWYFSKWETGKWFLPFVVSYSFEGANNLMPTEGEESDNDYHLDYCNVYTGVGFRGRVVSWKAFVGAGFLANAKRVYKGTSIDISDYVHKVNSLLGTSLEFCVGEHVSFGPSFIVKMGEVFDSDMLVGETSSPWAWSVTIGMRVAYRFALGKSNKSDSK